MNTLQSWRRTTGRFRPSDVKYAGPHCLKGGGGIFLCFLKERDKVFLWKNETMLPSIIVSRIETYFDHMSIKLKVFAPITFNEIMKMPVLQNQAILVLLIKLNFSAVEFSR